MLTKIPRHGIALTAWFVAGACAMLTSSQASAQMSEAEHLSHHPGLAPAAAQPGAMPAAPGAPGMGGMGPPAGTGPPGGLAGMGDMMKGMGKPPPKEMYPTLMALPEITPAMRLEVEQQSAERMHAGTLLMGHALDTLNTSTQNGDYAAMHEAAMRLREGIAQLESGVAARQALTEGIAPRDVALPWFKREMNLSSSAQGEESRPGRGLSVFHLFTMVLLVVFAFAMLAMYFFKMRRAAALFGRIEPGAGSPPPGSAPELAGGTPPGSDKPPSGDKPAAPAKKPAADAPPKAP